MKKKRLFAIFAAFAVAATMAIGFTACGNKDNNDLGDNTQTEQPDDGKGETPYEEDAGVTKEEWIKAWQDSVAADSYTLDYDGWTFMVSTDDVGNKYYTKLLYDNVNKTIYMQYADSNEASELYAEVVGSNLLRYINSNGEWLSAAGPAASWENGNKLLSYASTVYIVADATVSGTLAELYDYVTYDASSKAYSVDVVMSKGIITLKVQLSGGYLYKLFIAVEVDGETYEDEITFTGYNSTVVTVPEEVKNSVQ